jgi:hypothetical protein
MLSDRFVGNLVSFVPLTGNSGVHVYPNTVFTSVRHRKALKGAGTQKGVAKFELGALNQGLLPSSKQIRLLAASSYENRLVGRGERKFLPRPPPQP